VHKGLGRRGGGVGEIGQRLLHTGAHACRAAGALTVRHKAGEGVGFREGGGVFVHRCCPPVHMGGSLGRRGCGTWSRRAGG
jgi:hypothetical protein